MGSLWGRYGVAMWSLWSRYGVAMGYRFGNGRGVGSAFLALLEDIFTRALFLNIAAMTSYCPRAFLTKSFSFGVSSATLAFVNFRGGPRRPFSTPFFHLPLDLLLRYLVIVDLLRPRRFAITEGARASPSSYRHRRIYETS